MKILLASGIEIGPDLNDRKVVNTLHHDARCTLLNWDQTRAVIREKLDRSFPGKEWYGPLKGMVIKFIMTKENDAPER